MSFHALSPQPSTVSLNTRTARQQAALDADTTPPVLVSSSGSSQDSAMSVDGNIVLTFSEPIRAGTGVITIRLNGRVVIEEAVNGPNVTISGNSLVIDPAETLEAGMSYVLTIGDGAVLDLAGNAYHTWSWTWIYTALTSDPVQLTGTANNDTLNGGNGADTLSGNGGADYLSGNGGADLILGGDEEDRPWLFGDQISGGDGNDTMYGNGGDDRIEGADEGDDLLDGGTGDDTLVDSKGSNTMLGGAGNDQLNSESGGRSLLDGGAGNDKLVGDLGDTYLGGDGDDRIKVILNSPMASATTAEGGAGSDLFEVSGWGSSDARLELTGGAGSDTYKPPSPSGFEWAYTVTDFAAGSGGDRIDLTPFFGWNESGNPFAGAQPKMKLVQDGADTLLQVFQSSGNNVYWSVMRLENVQAGTLTGANFVDGIRPDGSTTGLSFSGGAGNDSLTGGIMDDTLDGGAGADTIDGGAGNDSITGGDAASDDGDRLYGQGGNDTLSGGAGNDTIRGGDGDDLIEGGAGNDVIDADGGNATVFGGAGDDAVTGTGSGLLDGGDGNDRLSVSANYGALGNVTVAGGNGNDEIVVAPGYTADAHVSVSGGAGGDLFVVRTQQGDADITVTDFSAAQGDRIDLLQMLPFGFNANPFGTPAYLRLQQDSADTVIWVDRDGAAGTQYGWEQVLKLSRVTAASLRTEDFAGFINPDGSSTGITLLGGGNADNLAGGLLDDVLEGGGGRDNLSGGGGNDLLNGGDEVIAGHGDLMTGGAGSDTLSGGWGADILAGDAGDDHLYGGAGIDELTGGDGDDKLDGGDGNDTLRDWSGANQMSGGAGNDLLENGGVDGAVLDGGSGDDTVSGGAGNDTLLGGTGHDLLRLQGSYPPAPLRIRIDAGDGDDTIEIRNYSARVDLTATGGAGADTYNFRSAFAGQLRITDFRTGAGGDRFDVFGLQNMWELQGLNPFGPGRYLRVVQEGADTLLQYDDDGVGGSAYGFRTIAVLEGVQASSLTSDNFAQGIRPDGDPAGLTLAGTAGSEELRGGVANDTITGAGGEDSVSGGGGNDALDGGDGADRLQGGIGNDYLMGGIGDDTVYGESGDDHLAGGDGDDQLMDDLGSNVLEGGAGNDRLVSGSNGTSRVDGGDGNDTVAGGYNDTLFGGAGNDLLELTYSWLQPADGAFMLRAHGGDGNDTFGFAINRASQSVLATGGAGSDTYRLLAAWDHVGSYAVTDFDTGAGGDRVDLSGLVMNLYPPSNPFGAASLLRIVQRGNDAVVQYDRDGADGIRLFQDMLVLQGVSAQSLTANQLGGFSPDGSSKGYTYTGTDGADTFTGNLMDDSIAGGAGADRLEGQAGNDFLWGGDGADDVGGGEGNDMIDGGAGDDQLHDWYGANTIDGGAGNDYIDGQSGDASVLRGGDGNDSVLAGTGNDAIDGGAGMDRLNGNAGNDTIDGGAGTDFAISGWSSDFTITRDGDVITLTDNSGWRGTDTLRNIERIMFSNTTIAYDVGADGVAGEVYRLYQAAFDRTPDAFGVGFWIAAGDSGMALSAIASAFVHSAEFESLYGSAPSHAELVRLMYINALHREPDQAGLDYWTNALATGAIGTVDLLVAFSESPENQQAVAAVIGNGFAYQPYF